MSLVSNRLEKSTDRCRNLSFEIKTSFADLDLIREEWDQFVLSVDGGVFFPTIGVKYGGNIILIKENYEYLYLEIVEK